ncbi:MAG: hypothetical protein JSS75_10255 [Bacteroidetes bacterium]|nr:hypothetical protein [Bacteroidota bacterium]
MLGGFRIEERRAIRILIVIAVISRLALAFRPEWRIFTRPYSEDSFYIFSVSEHLAHGDGITVDGVHPTNGIQPLIAFLYVPFFWIAGANKLLALRLCFIVVALCDGFSVLVLAKLLRRLVRGSPDEDRIVWLRPHIAAPALWALLYPILVHTAVGLETGVYSSLLIASTYCYATLRKEGATPSLMQWIGFGTLLGLTVLARIDAVFIVIAFCLVELIHYGVAGIKSAAVFGATAFVVSLPWWAYNYFVFGHLMPQSGMSESIAGLFAENLRRGAIVIGDILTVFLFLPNYKLPAWFHFVWMFALLALVVLLARKFGAVSFLRRTYDLRPLAPLAILSAVLIVYYVFFFSAPHFLPRYFQPFRILWLILFAASVPLLVQFVRRSLSVRRTLTRTLLWVAGLGAAGFGASLYGYSFFVPHPSEFYLAGQWAKAHPNALIGMEQSGTAGFIAPNVVNLDGKVDFGALKAKMRGDIGSYVIERKLEYVGDWREIIDPIVASANRDGALFIPSDTLGKIYYYKRQQ